LRNPYLELGLNPQATPEQIRAAFRNAVRKRHPDTAGEPTDDEAVRDAIDADHLLIDPTARAAYDARRDGGAVPPRHGGVRSATGHGIPVPCPTCIGTGMVTFTAACPRCGGRAEITDLSRHPARVLRCRDCRGRGRVRTIGPCPGCDGAGTGSVPGA